MVKMLCYVFFFFTVTLQGLDLRSETSILVTNTYVTVTGDH